MPLETPLVWPGGKRWLLPHIRPIWKRYKDRRLVEPFCGALSVTLGLLPARAVLNDINPHLINFLQAVKDGLFCFGRFDNTEEAYYENREKFNSLIKQPGARPKDLACLFYYLNRTGFHGLVRFNSAGEYNASYGFIKHLTYINDFRPYQGVFQPWTFNCGPFESVDLDPGDFVFADPPYDVKSRQYTDSPFSWEDQTRLVEWLLAHRGPVILTNQATPRVVKLYRDSGFDLFYFEAPRRISCDGDRESQWEVLAVRNIDLSQPYKDVRKEEEKTLDS